MNDSYELTSITESRRFFFRGSFVLGDSHFVSLGSSLVMILVQDVLRYDMSSPISSLFS